MDIIRTEFSFESNNGTNTVRGVRYLPADGNCKAILHISHGMVEHYDRYDDFMTYMAQNGFAVYMHDHIGHKHSVESHADRQSLCAYADFVSVYAARQRGDKTFR